MGVGGPRDAVGLLWQGLPSAALGAERCKTCGGTGAERERPPPGRCKALGAGACAQPHDPATRPAALVGLRPCGQERFDDRGGGWATGGRPVQHALGRPCGRVLGGLGHGGGPRPRAACGGRARVTGDALPRGDACHDGGTEADVERRAHQRVGHGGVVAVHLPVGIALDPGELPLRRCRGLGRQRRERRAVEGLPQRGAGARPWLHGAGREGRQAGREGRRARRQRAAGVGSQASQPPAVDDLPPHCDLGVSPGLGRPGREHGTAIVRCAGRSGPLEHGGRAVGPGDGRLAGSGDDARGDPAKCRQGPHRGAEPVGQTLGPGGCGRGGAGGPQDRHQPDRLVDLPAGAVEDGDTRTGVIPAARFPRTGGLAPHPRQRACPGAIGVTTPTGRPALRRGSFLFLPQQKQGNPLPFECVVHGRPRGPHGRCRRSGRGRRQQPPLQCPRLAGRGPGPGQAGSLGPTHRLGDRRPTKTETLGELPLTQALAPFETQHLGHWTQSAPLCRPLLLPLRERKAQETEGGARHRLRSIPPVGWQLCRGIGGRLRPASVAALAGNTQVRRPRGLAGPSDASAPAGSAA